MSDDKMSSVSKSSRFSAKSQIIIDAQDKTIAEQGGQISEMAKEMQAMKRMLAKAGLNPDMALDPGPDLEIES